MIDFESKDEKSHLHSNQEDKNPIQQEQSAQEKVSGEDNYKEQLIRLSADFQNYKKRMERERLEWMISGQTHILEKILPIFDELDRAIALALQQPHPHEWINGISLIQKNWQKTFDELGIEEIATEGTFNPDLHEALMQEEDANKQPGDIGKTFSKGYRYKGKVIRHAKVSVIK